MDFTRDFGVTDFMGEGLIDFDSIIEVLESKTDEEEDCFEMLLLLCTGV